MLGTQTLSHLRLIKYCYFRLDIGRFVRHRARTDTHLRLDFYFGFEKALVRRSRLKIAVPLFMHLGQAKVQVYVEAAGIHLSPLFVQVQVLCN